MELSILSWSIRGTLGRKLLKKSLQYSGVVDFTLGDPDIPTPDGICKAAIRAIKEHKTRYTAAGGIMPLREAVAAIMAEETGMPLTAENVAICASTPSQWAALEAVTHHRKYALPIRETFRARREVLIEALKDVPKIRFIRPAATFYLFVDISETGMDSRTFCDRLLEQEHVAVTPGLSFGDAFDGYIRLAFTLNEDVLREGAKRIRRFIESNT